MRHEREIHLYTALLPQGRGMYCSFRDSLSENPVMDLDLSFIGYYDGRPKGAESFSLFYARGSRHSGTDDFQTFDEALQALIEHEFPEYDSEYA